TQLAQNQQHGDILVNYQKDISDLLLNQQLGKTYEGGAIRVVAQAKTLAALSALDQDGQRKGLIIQFLYDAQLIQTRHPIIDLNHAELNEAKLSGAHLRNVNLSGANMRG